MSTAQSAQAGSPSLDKQIVAALGSTFVPSKPGDPGYKELEVHGITDYVMRRDEEGERGGPDQRETGVLRRDSAVTWLEHEALAAGYWARITATIRSTSRSAMRRGCRSSMPITGTTTTT